MKDSLIAVYNFLNEIEVTGFKNIVNLYKVIVILEGMINDINKKETEELKKTQETSTN